MSYEAYMSEVRNADRIGDAELNEGTQAAEALARAQAAFLDAIAKYNRVQNVHQIDVETIEAVLHDEIPDADWVIEQLEEAYRG